MTNLLYIENEEEQRVLYTMFLESEGFTVTAVATADEGIALLGALHNFDAVVTDNNTGSSSSGLDLLRRFGRNLPVIILSADEISDEVVTLDGRYIQKGQHRIFDEIALIKNLLGLEDASAFEANKPSGGEPF